MQVINEVEVKEYDSEMLNEVPDLVGYIVQRNDTLWNIAKSNFTTMTQIINVNKLENSRIKEGEDFCLRKPVMSKSRILLFTKIFNEYMENTFA